MARNAPKGMLSSGLAHHSWGHCAEHSSSIKAPFITTAYPLLGGALTRTVRQHDENEHWRSIPWSAVRPFAANTKRAP
jgi:hypothetical protein